MTSEEGSAFQIVKILNKTFKTLNETFVFLALEKKYKKEIKRLF